MLLKLGLAPSAAPVPLAKLGASLGISASEIHGAINRASAAGLLDLDQRRTRVLPLLEFLEHGIRYVFISRPGGITRGVPTAHSAPPLSGMLMQGSIAKMLSNRVEDAANADPYGSANVPGPIERLFSNEPVLPNAIVWPHPEGEVRGESLEPLYPSAVDAARLDQGLYECLALVDALRVGRARERKLAIDLLAKRLRPS